MTNSTPAARLSGRRISFVLEGLNASGGVGVLLSVAEALAAAGAEVGLTVPDYASELLVQLSPAIRIETVITRGRGPIRKLAYFAKLTVGFGRSADVVVFSGFKLAWISEVAFRLFRRTGQRVYFIQGAEDFQAQLRFELSRGTRALACRLARGSYSLPVRVITVSQWLRNHIGRFDAAVIAPGFDERPFKAAKGRRPPTTKLVIGVFASSAAGKGFDIFRAALSSLRCEEQQELYLLVGAASASEPATALKVPVEFEVRRTFTADEVAQFYRSCDLFVFPSLREGFGLPPLEAMASGVAVLMTDCGGVREYASQENARICAAGSPSALAEEVRSILKSKESLSDTIQPGLATAAMRTRRKAMMNYVEYFASL